MLCQKTFIWKALNSRSNKQRSWFKLWITESCSISLLCKLSGYSKAKLSTIKDYWLGQKTEDQIDCCKIIYMIYDGTYFHKDGCMLNLMNAQDQKIISHIYVKKESFKDSYPWFLNLKKQGLNPRFISTDGERSIVRAMRLAWPEARLQRCLYHIQHEGMRWLRTYPKTEAGRELRNILSKLSWIKTAKERDSFIEDYLNWLNKFREFIKALPRTTVAFEDLRRTVGLINNALPDMFYYLEDPNVHSTTNALEGFHSRLKADYHRHRGLTKKHRLQYLDWYCHYENTPD